MDRALLTQTLDNIIGRVEAASSLVKVQKKHGSRRERPWKLAAAYYAYDLIARYSPRKPSLTKDGRFFRVASLLFGTAQDFFQTCLEPHGREIDAAITRERDPDLTRYCRFVFAKNRDEPYVPFRATPTSGEVLPLNTTALTFFTNTAVTLFNDFVRSTKKRADH